MFVPFHIKNETHKEYIKRVCEKLLSEIYMMYLDEEKCLENQILIRDIMMETGIKYQQRLQKKEILDE